MKKLFTLFLPVLLVNSLFAQLPVSTIPENKNVVLEEFTGIHCGYCPDGHLLAQQFHDANPGDVILVNIHTGSYATPSAGEPDFRADPLGSTIAGQSSLTGYPAGTINRHVFPGVGQSGGTAMSRGSWASSGGQMFAQPSCVNVAADASLDISTRVLTVDVEAYYTDNSTNQTNKINVVLLQNNVEGPQSNGATYNPGAMLPNGNYNHQHMFRHLLTGQWGDDITATTTGSLFQNTYTYSIPADLNGVAYDLFNLDVAVFVAEGQQEILSGNMADMTHIVPPGVNLIDLSSTTNMVLPASFCDNNVVPEITVTNNSTIAVDTFEVSYTLNTNTPVTQTVYSSLASGASTTITFTSISVPAGTNTISFFAGTLAGTSFIDNVPSNNISSSGSFNTMSPFAQMTSRDEGFEGYANETPAPTGAILINPLGHRVFIVDPTFTQGQPIGAFGMSPNSFRWQFINMSGGDNASLIFDQLKFSATQGNALIYSYAYAQTSGFENDRLQILVSEDCGANFTLISQKMGPDLATSPPVAGANFYPNAGHWATDTVDLTAYDLAINDVMIKITGICAGGNNLYIDDIIIDANIMASTTGITENNNDFLSTNIFPNPMDNTGILKLNIDKKENITIDIYDVLGKQVKKIANKNLSSGIHNISFDVSDLENGSYLIRTQSKDMINNLKFVVSH